MTRVIADCRRLEASAPTCTLTIIGEPDEVIAVAAQHAVAVHGQKDTPELRERFRALLEPEASYQETALWFQL